jgi:hypothetical protein
MEIMVLGIIAAGACAIIAAPLMRTKNPYTRGQGIPVHLPDDAALEHEVARYRQALRAGTVCVRCRFANPPEGRFCADCGKRLPGA